MHRTGCVFAAAMALIAAMLSSPARAQPNEGLRVESPPAVLNDPLVKRCRFLAARRTDPALDPITTGVEKAAMMFELEPLFDGVAACRAALAVYPSEPAVIIPHYNAAEALKMLTLGLKFPDAEAEAFALVLATASRPGPASTMEGQMFGFFLGSAYEWGVGTKPDREAAMKWYATAAQAGDRISERELKRLQSRGP